MCLYEDRLPKCIWIVWTWTVFQQPFTNGRMWVICSGIAIACYPQGLLNFLHLKSHIDECVDGILKPVRFFIFVAVKANNFQ